jgi:hypothetical protein
MLIPVPSIPYNSFVLGVFLLWSESSEKTGAVSKEQTKARTKAQEQDAGTMKKAQ